MREADAAILYPLKRELAMIKDLKHDAGIFELSKVIALPEGEQTEPDNLIARERENAIQTFVDAWLAERNRLMLKWESGIDDDQT